MVVIVAGASVDPNENPVVLVTSGALNVVLVVKLGAAEVVEEPKLKLTDGFARKLAMVVAVAVGVDVEVTSDVFSGGEPKDTKVGIGELEVTIGDFGRPNEKELVLGAEDSSLDVAAEDPKEKLAFGNSVAFVDDGDPKLKLGVTRVDVVVVSDVVDEEDETISVGFVAIISTGFSIFLACASSASFCFLRSASSSSVSNAVSRFSTRFSSKLRSCSRSLALEIRGLTGLEITFSGDFLELLVLTKSDILGKITLVDDTISTSFLSSVETLLLPLTSSAKTTFRTPLLVDVLLSSNRLRFFFC